MKNQILSQFHICLIGVSLALLGLLVTGCSGSVNGQVFLDKNNNGSADFDESGVPFAKISITHNEKAIASGYTGPDGEFKIKSRGKGEYCVSIIEDPDTNPYLASPTKAQLFPGTTVAPATTPPATTAEEKKDESSTDDKQETTTTTQPAGWKGNKYCLASAGSWGVEIAVPVGLDRKAALDDAVPISRTVGAGEEFYLALPIQEGGTLMPLTLPEGLEYVRAGQTGIGFDAELNRLTFSENLSELIAKSAEIKAQVTAPVVTPQVEIFRLRLRAAKDVKDGGSVEIKPIIEFGSEKIALNPITIKFTRDISANIMLDLKGRTLPGNTVTLNVIIENTGKVQIDKASAKVTIPAEITVKEPLPAGVRNFGSGVIIDVRKLPGGEKLTVELELIMPAILPTNMKFAIPATLDSEELEETMVADPIEIRMSATQ